MDRGEEKGEDQSINHPRKRQIEIILETNTNLQEKKTERNIDGVFFSKIVTNGEARKMLIIEACRFLGSDDGGETNLRGSRPALGRAVGQRTRWSAERK